MSLDLDESHLPEPLFLIQMGTMLHIDHVNTGGLEETGAMYLRP